MTVNYSQMTMKPEKFVKKWREGRWPTLRVGKTFANITLDVSKYQRHLDAVGKNMPTKSSFSYHELKIYICAKDIFKWFFITFFLSDGIKFLTTNSVCFQQFNVRVRRMHCVTNRLNPTNSMYLIGSFYNAEEQKLLGHKDRTMRRNDDAISKRDTIGLVDRTKRRWGILKKVGRFSLLDDKFLRLRSWWWLIELRRRYLQ